MVQIPAEIKEIIDPNHRIEANVYPLGDVSGQLSDTAVNVYNTVQNNYNWMKVKIFFDTWNDLYNITFQQYKNDGEQDQESVGQDTAQSV